MLKSFLLLLLLLIFPVLLTWVGWSIWDFFTNRRHLQKWYQYKYRFATYSGFNSEWWLGVVRIIKLGDKYHVQSKSVSAADSQWGSIGVPCDTLAEAQTKAQDYTERYNCSALEDIKLQALHKKLTHTQGVDLWE